MIQWKYTGVVQKRELDDLVCKFLPCRCFFKR